MGTSFHPLKELFEQLGVESSAEGIEKFLQAHAPLPPGVALTEAPFWSTAQADFLREALLSDSDWTQAADALNTALHEVSWH